MSKRIEYETKWIRDEPGEETKTIDIPKERLHLLHFVFDQDNWRPWLKIKIEGLDLSGITHLFVSLNEVDEIEKKMSVFQRVALWGSHYIVENLSMMRKKHPKE